MQITRYTIRTSVFTMDAFSFGTGKRPFVILPGISLKPVSLSAEAVAGAYAAFADTYTVYVFDRRREMEEGYSVADMAEDTAEAMRMLGIRRAVVFGASQGGMIALGLAIRHPELVGSMILASTFARPNPRAHAVLSRWIELAKLGDPTALNRDMFEKIYSEDYRVRYCDAFAALEKEGTPEELRRVAILSEACLRFDVFAELGKVVCPTLVIGSKEDHVLSWEGYVELAGQIRGASLEEYEGYGHAVYDEAPDYKARMLCFLQQIRMPEIP